MPVEQLRKILIDTIPCASSTDKAELMSKPFLDVLLSYLQWADRYIHPKKRKTHYSRFILGNPNFLQLGQKIIKIEKKINKGEDLTHHLSKRIDTGYSNTSNRWNRARDFTINRLGVHHLHLEAMDHAKNNSKGTDELLFIQFYRNDAVFLHLGDHKSFMDGSLDEAVAAFRSHQDHYVMNGITSEPDEVTFKNGAILARHGLSQFFSYKDKTILGNQLVSSGHSLEHVTHLQKVSHAVDELAIEFKKEKPFTEYFTETNTSYPNLPRFKFQMNYCDLILTETTTNQSFLIVPWSR